MMNIARLSTIILAVATVARAEIAPSEQPPISIPIDQTPQFVTIGFDDNPDVECMEWIVEFMRDKKSDNEVPARVAFYTNGMHLLKSDELKNIHLQAWKDGHEIANHTQNHHHGFEFTKAQWEEEMQICQKVLSSFGIPESEIRGFRTPFIEYNAPGFEAMESVGFRYDSSLSEGFQKDQDGTNFYWPYTLHNGSPANLIRHRNEGVDKIGNHPTLWEIPVHGLMIPKDEDCAPYGIETGVIQRIKKTFTQADYGSWSAEDGKVTGFDWNILEMAQLTPEEYLGILKYNLDLRLAGNRAPMMVGAHTALYNTPERRLALEQFIDYALSFDSVRFVTPTKIIEWMENPAPLK